MKNYQLPEDAHKDAFKLPENYFQQFQQQIEEKVDSMEAAKKQQAEVIPMWTKIRPYLYLAAMFVILFVGIRGFLFVTDDKAPGIAQELLEQPDSSPLESEYSAEEYLMGSVSASTMLYYLYEDAITEPSK